MYPAFASWSGGKDCCLALHTAKFEGIEVRQLFNMVSEDGQRSRSHGIRAAVIKQQAEALGIPILQQPTVDEGYEEVFIKTLKEFKQSGIVMGIFGDIDFSPHREWIEKVCKAADITPYLPLWQADQLQLVEEFIAAGYKAIVVATRTDLMGKEFLGRTLDYSLIADIAALNKDITPCGEAGEFHTLVVDGPIFVKRLELTKTEIVTRMEHHFLEIHAAELKDKK
jgi:diphthine-ammonia ligase